MKSLLFLFILDFSGSMYQEVDGKYKYQILQENVKENINSTTQEEKQRESGILVFGLDPSKKCKDVNYTKMSTGDVFNRVNSFKPGSFSMTPLALAIRQGVDIKLKQGVERLFIYSDGADSCGEDPCSELDISNEKLKQRNLTLDISFVGIDLKEDASKFECFNKPFSNIRINNSNVDNLDDLKAAIEKSKKDFSKKNQASINVSGAPRESVFKAIGEPYVNLNRSELARAKGEIWKTDDLFKIDSGSYRVITNKKNTIFVDVKLEDNKLEKLFWSDFFLKKTVEFKFKRNGITILLTPSRNTLKMHRLTPKDVYVESPYGTSNLFVENLAFGEWKVKIISPPWLKSGTDEIDLDLSPETVNFELNPLVAFNLKLEKVPDSQKSWVLEVDDTDRFFVQKGFKLIPVPKDSKIKWIGSRL